MRSIVHIGKAEFATGLFWQTAPTAAVAAREARIVAKKMELAADLFCVRKKGVPQFALGRKAGGLRSGVRALAAAVANSVAESNWIGVFPIDRAWFFIAVRQGAILPDGDFLFDDEIEAKNRLLGEMAAGSWSRVFAPTDWRIPEGQPTTLPQLPPRSHDGRLQSVGRSWARHGAFAAVTVVALLAGWSQFAPHSPQPARVPEVPPAPPPLPPPWQGQPSVEVLARVCQTAMERTKSLPGFDVESISCGRGGTTAVFHRTWGVLTRLPPNAKVSSPDRVVLGDVLPAVSGERKRQEQPGTIEALRRTIWGAGQRYLLDSEISDPPTPGATLLADRRTSGPEAPSYHAVNVVLGGRIPPTVLSKVLTSIPAFVVDEISWQSMVWHVRGKAYVR
jgi:hypothetical protein